MSARLLSVGVSLPPAKRVEDLARDAGIEPGDYKGWEHVTRAGPGEQPSTFAARALQQALERAGEKPERLGAILFCGATRDFPAPWPVATEVLRLVGGPESCASFDVVASCQGAQPGLALAEGLVTGDPSRLVAVVAGERWSSHLDLVRSGKGYWAHADGGSAMVFGSSGAAPLIHVGTALRSLPDRADQVLIEDGGTARPVPAEGLRPSVLVTPPRPIPMDQLRRNANACFRGAVDDLRQRHPFEPRHLVFGQVAPMVLDELCALAGVPRERAVVTGHRYGHVGAADLAIGLAELLERGVEGDVLMLCNSRQTFGASLFHPT